MALIAGATRITLDGQRAIDCFDTAPFTVARPATLAEQISVLGSAAEVLRVSLNTFPPVHTGSVSASGGVFTVTVNA